MPLNDTELVRIRDRARAGTAQVGEVIQLLDYIVELERLAYSRVTPKPDPVIVWMQGDEIWACDAHDHGPMCRRCSHIGDFTRRSSS